jgi:hypothetical protein
VSEEFEAAEYLAASGGRHCCVVQESKGLINMNAQILDVALWQDGGIHNSQWWVGRKADILVLTVGRQTVEQLGFGE